MSWNLIVSPLLEVVVALLCVVTPESLWGEPLDLSIGVIQSLTGAAEEDGQTIVRALRLAEAEIEKQGWARISLEIEDDGTVPKNAVSAYERLKAKKVSVIIGPAWSFLVNTLAPLAGRDNVVLLTTSNAPEVLEYEAAKGNLFSNSFRITSVGGPLAFYLEKENAKRAAFIGTDTAWAHAHRSVLRRVLQEKNVALYDDVMTPAVSNNDFREVVPRLKSAGVDLVIMLLSRDDSESFLRRASELRYRPRYFAAAHTYDSVVRTKNITLYEGVCLAYPYRQLRANQGFFEAYRQRYGEDPRIYADTSYDALFIVARALETALRSGESLQSALRETTFEGVAGRYAFSRESSLSAGTNDLVCVQNGTLFPPSSLSLLSLEPRSRDREGWERWSGAEEARAEKSCTG